MREKFFGAMAASAIILNALYIAVNVFLSPRGVEYPFVSFGGVSGLILSLFLYGPALVALALFLHDKFGNYRAEN